MVERQQRAVGRRETVERPIQEVDLGCPIVMRTVRLHGGPDPLPVHQERARGDLVYLAALPPADRRPAGIHDDAAQPRREERRVAQLRQVGPGTQEDLLRGISRVGLVAEDRHRGAERGLDPRHHQERKRVVVARAGALHQPRFGDPPRGGRQVPRHTRSGCRLVHTHHDSDRHGSVGHRPLRSGTNDCEPPRKIDLPLGKHSSQACPDAWLTISMVTPGAVLGAAGLCALTASGSSKGCGGARDGQRAMDPIHLDLPGCASNQRAAPARAEPEPAIPPWGWLGLEPGPPSVRGRAPGYGTIMRMRLASLM